MPSKGFSYEILRNKGFTLKDGVFVKNSPAEVKSTPKSKKHKIQFSENTNNHFKPLADSVSEDSISGIKKPRCVFNITPIGKPRMTIGDKANHRETTKIYWEYKSELNRIAAENNYYIEKTLDVEFHMPMPESWSEKKKAKICGTPHENIPDIDNLFKSLSDCLCKQDKAISDVKMRKRWAYSGMILIYE